MASFKNKKELDIEWYYFHAEKRSKAYKGRALALPCAIKGGFL